MTAIALQHRDAFIQGLAKGQRISDIVGELGLDVSRQAISKVLKGDPEYREAVENGFEVRLDQAESAVATAGAHYFSEITALTKSLSEDTSSPPDPNIVKRLDVLKEAAMVDVARARDRFKAVAWRAERECPGRWGAKVDQMQGAISINVVNYVVQAPQTAVQHGQAGEVIAVNSQQVIDTPDIAALPRQ